MAKKQHRRKHGRQNRVLSFAADGPAKVYNEMNLLPREAKENQKEI
jgi:hypothetical protein